MTSRRQTFLATLMACLLPAAVVAADVVFNEIMYHSASEASSEEFIELKNVGASSVNLNGWEITRGVRYVFPDVTLDAGEYVIVAADTAVFESTYGIAGSLGNWSGTLSNRGERLTLVDADGNGVHDVSYSDQGDWATRIKNTDTSVTLGENGWVWHAAHDGAGESLELTNASLLSATDEGPLWKSSSGGPTPGTANSTAASAFAPIITKVKHTPPVPTSSDAVMISARVVDVPGTPCSVDLRHRESTSNPGAFQTTAMNLVSGNTYAATLPALADGTIIEFYVEATDGTLSRTWPAPTDQGQTANALYQVDDEVHDDTVPFYRLLMTVPDEADYDSFDKDSNAQVNTTLIAFDCQETKIRYQCGTRIRGKASRYGTPRPMRLKLPRDRPLDGITDMNLNQQESHLQSFGQKLFQAAGLPSVKLGRSRSVETA